MAIAEDLLLQRLRHVLVLAMLLLLLLLRLRPWVLLRSHEAHGQARCGREMKHRPIRIALTSTWTRPRKPARARTRREEVAQHIVVLMVVVEVSVLLCVWL